MNTKSVNFIILFLFVFFEVFLFEGNVNAQFAITTVEYLFLTFTLFRNIELGISYFVCFTLLALGQETQMQSDAISLNFFSVRLGGFSVNTLYSILLLFYSLIRKRGSVVIVKDINFYFFSLFFCFSFFTGIVNLAINNSYIDNFIKDFFTYFSFFVYIYILYILNEAHLKKIVKYGVSLTCISILLSFIFNKFVGNKIGYGSYVLSNSFMYILPVLLVFLRKEFSKIEYLIYASIFIFALVKGSYFLSAKNILTVIFVLTWIALNSKKSKGIYMSILVILIFSIIPVFNFFIYYYQGTFIAFKFSQILDVFLVSDVTSLASKETSMGNFIAETVTLIGYLTDNLVFLFIGKGFGAGIPDLYGYLASWAGNSGYAEHDLIRNDFHKLHLPILEVFLKTGLLGIFFYLYMVSSLFFSKNKYSLFYLIMVLTAFYITKEHFLLTLVLLVLIKKESKKNKYIKK